MKQQGNIYQCYVRPVLLYCCETWELTVANEAWLRQVERLTIRMCGVRLVDRVSTDVLRDRVGVAVKTEDMIIQSRLRWYGHVMRGDFKVEITGKKEEGSTKESVGRVRKEGFGTIWLDKKGCVRSKEMARAKFEQRLLTPASRDNGIKTDVLIVVLEAKFDECCCFRVARLRKSYLLWSNTLSITIETKHKPSKGS